jgi:glycosyltransferase involved in cell wall biosynthesis
MRLSDTLAMPASLPLISCLCVTRGKPEKLRRAIDCFFAQKYSNKELVVVYEDDDPATHLVAQSLISAGRADLIAVRARTSPKMMLGELRTLAVERSRGEYFCQWDDDDWYHNERLLLQLAALSSSRSRACILTHWLMFDEMHHQAYCSHRRLWEGSILCRKDVATSELQYPAEAKGEDNIFTQGLVARGYVHPLLAPGLYIYTVHGKNTWPRDHFEWNFSRAQKLSKETSRLIGDILAGRYSIAEASAHLSSEDLLGQLTCLVQR